MKPTTMNHPSGPELRRQSAAAFGPLFSKPRRVTEGRSLHADFVPAATDDASIAPPTESGAVASTPFKCSKCGTTATLHAPAKFCLRCGTPTVPVESAATGDRREVHESAKPTEKRVEASNLLALRQAIGAKYAGQMQPSPLTAASIRADMERLAGRKSQTDRAEREALDALAAKK